MTSSSTRKRKGAKAPFLARFSDRRAVVLWVLLVLFVIGIARAHWWYGNRHNYYDLGIYRQAVNWWLHGHDLYTFTKPDATQGQLGFTYPPFGALVLVPFAVLPWGFAIALYAALTLGAVVVTTYWLVKPVAQRHAWSLPFVMVFALTVISTLEPMRENYTFGQINVLLAILVLADLLILVPRGSKWAGVCIGIAAAIKLTPAIFIVYLLVSRRRRAAITAMVSAAAATLLAGAVMPRGSWDFWTHDLWSGQGLGNAGYTFNQSIYAMLARFSAPHDPDKALWALLVVVALGYGLWRARSAALAGDEVVGLTIAGFTGCLISPITWAHHLYWFVPALVVLVDVAASGPRRARWGYGGFAALITVTVGLGMVSWFEQGLPRHPWGDGVQGFLIENWYLLLTVALVIALPVRARSTTPTETPDARARALR